MIFAVSFEIIISRACVMNPVMNEKHFNNYTIIQ
jgi:hypothetical protein